jgi:chemotaxis response regulator CheB
VFNLWGKGLADFPIVGIGSSAGGLEALEKLFEAMPPDTGAALVVVAHLDPSFDRAAQPAHPDADRGGRA